MTTCCLEKKNWNSTVSVESKSVADYRSLRFTLRQITFNSENLLTAFTKHFHSSLLEKCRLSSFHETNCGHLFRSSKENKRKRQRPPQVKLFLRIKSLETAEHWKRTKQIWKKFVSSSDNTKAYRKADDKERVNVFSTWLIKIHAIVSAFDHSIQMKRLEKTLELRIEWELFWVLFQLKKDFYEEGL